MAYSKGSKVLSADFTRFSDDTFAIYGPGNGDKGYGQTAIANPNGEAAGELVEGDEWVTVRDAVEKCLIHQGAATTLVPPATEFDEDDKIVAQTPIATSYDFSGMITKITNDRFVAGSNTLLLNQHTITRGSNWSGTITAIFRAQFNSGDEARYFFNSGGEIRLRFNHPNTVNTNQDNNWRTVLSDNVGTLTLNANSFARTGTSGVINIRGYYLLSDSYIRLYDGSNIGSTAYTNAYSANDVLVDVRTNGTQGSLNDNGNEIFFQVQLRDDHTGPSDTVASGTQVIADVLYANDGNTVSVTPPTWFTFTSF